MKVVFGLFVILFRVSHGVETFCDGRQNGAKCYGALGGTVVLRLMDDASKIFRSVWIFNTTTTILRWRNNMILSNLIENRSSFSPSNGTFRINDLSRNDGGEYTLVAHKDNSGSNQEKRTLQLTIQAPVSSVLLVSECLSQGEMKASCSSEGGDSPQYRWTLGGQTLTQTQLLSGNSESQNITVKQDVSGELVCSVRNDVSVVRKEKQTCGFTFLQCTLSNGTYISKWFPPTLCPQPTPEALPLLYCGLRAAVVFLILTGIFVYFACKKNDLKKAEGSAVHEVTEYENYSVVMLEMRSSASRL
nr:uncharacterized protein LOC109992634 [Labrus bergylta]